MNKLIVEVREGLCNRLRVLISASYLAVRYRRELILCWRPNRACGARFTDLFTNPVTEIDALPDHPQAHIGSPPEVLARAMESSDPVVCVSECHWLLSDDDHRKSIPHFVALQPVDSVLQAVDAIAAQFAARTIGVHVRRGDFAGQLSKKHNLKLPTMQRYFSYLDKWKGAIFLATDGGDEVMGEFRARYGNRLMISPQHCPGRNTSQAVQEALVDLYLLQRCQAIIGTRYSSFSELAWCITRTPYAKVSEREATFLAKLKFSSRLLLGRFRRI